jgi:molybdopterin molybdotransferase
MSQTNQLSESPCSCDDEGAQGRLVPVNTALARGLALAETVSETDEVALENSFGRVLARAVTTPVPLPPFDNSAMDGYALRIADLTGNGPWTLPVSGRIAAGDSGDVALAAGSALRILTGAPVPRDIDAIIMQEHVQRDGDTITLTEKPTPGMNIRRRGEDLPEGAAILPAGCEIGPREACALAASGAATITVRRKIKVAMFCTGSELVAPGQALTPGKIWNSNRFMLLSTLAKPWIEIIDLGTVPDTPADLSATLVQASKIADMVISTGGVSVGDEDHMPRLFREAGGDIHAMRVAMKPGKPIAIGKMGDAIYVGLPGNPVSAFVTWHIIGAAILAKRTGATHSGFVKTLVKSGFETTRRPGRCEFRPARIVGVDGQGTEVAQVLSPSYSARVALLSSADGLLCIPADAEKIHDGDLLEFLRF